jgi:hypothetical protein
MDQIIAVLGPVKAGGGVANMVRHPPRTRREQHKVGTSFSLQA